MMGKKVITLLGFACALLSASVVNAQTQQGAKAPKAVAAKAVANTAKVGAAKDAAKSAHKVVQIDESKIATVDKSKIAKVDSSKLVPKAQIADKVAEAKKAKDAKNAKPKKKLRSRNQVINIQVVSWGPKMADAESACLAAVRKYAGEKRQYNVKDISFVRESSTKLIAFLRADFTENIIDGFKLQLEVTAGYGTTRERAYTRAMQKAAFKVKTVRSASDNWSKVDSNIKNSNEEGFFPYLYSCEKINDEYICKIYFQYIKPVYTK